MLVKIKRGNITIQGIYTPKDKAPTGGKLGAQFNIITINPKGTEVHSLTPEEWTELREKHGKKP